MLCPKCSGILDERFSQGVEIDVCRDCGGVWLDRGELDKIMAATAPAVLASGSASAQDGEDHTEDRTEGPLEESDERSSEDKEHKPTKVKKSKESKKSKKNKKKRKKGWADMLEDVLDDVLDFD